MPWTLPSGWYEDPSIWKLVADPGSSPSRRIMLMTHISLVVSVPVLSEQMTVVQPRVWTFGSLRMMAFYLAILLAPKARQVVMTAGNPSGMAATANATATLK